MSEGTKMMMVIGWFFWGFNKFREVGFWELESWGVREDIIRGIKWLNVFMIRGRIFLPSSWLYLYRCQPHHRAFWSTKTLDVFTHRLIQRITHFILKKSTGIQQKQKVLTQLRLELGIADFRGYTPKVKARSWIQMAARGTKPTGPSSGLPC